MKEEEFKSNLHCGGCTSVIKLSREEEQVANTPTKAMGLGMAGVVMLQSKHGPLVIEVNLIPGLEGIKKATEINIISKIIQYIEKNAHRGKVQRDKVNA